MHTRSLCLMDKLQRGNLQFSPNYDARREFSQWRPSSNPQLNRPTCKHSHSHRHTPCIVFSSAQLLMDKQRAVNCDGLSADIFPSHILAAQETYTRAGTVKREEKLKVKHTRCAGCSHAHRHTLLCTHDQTCMDVFTNRYKQTEDLQGVQIV